MEKFLRSGAWFECGSSVVEADISSEVFRDFSVKNSAAVWTVVNKSCTIPEEYPRSCLRRRRRSMNEDGFASERGWEKYVRFRFEGVFWYLESIIPSESAHRLPLSETFESLDFESRKESIDRTEKGTVGISSVPYEMTILTLRLDRLNPRVGLDRF